MRALFKNIIFNILKFYAGLILNIYRPKIIGITGSVGKSTLKDTLYEILRVEGKRVLRSNKNYNSDIGIALSLLELKTGYNNLLIWIKNLAFAPIKVAFFNYKYVVLEFGIDKKNDMDDILSFVIPDISIINRLQKVPVHVENFDDNKELLYREKAKLLENTKEEGVVVVNIDDPIQLEIIKTSHIKAKKITRIDKEISLVRHSVHLDNKNNPVGMDFVLNVKNKEEHFYIPETLGLGTVETMINAVLLAFVVDENINISSIRRAIASTPPLKGRARILNGLDNSIIIDGSYNASPTALETVCDSIIQIPNKKKILILGNLAELGSAKIPECSRIINKIKDEFDYILVSNNVSKGEYGDAENIEYYLSFEDLVDRARTLQDDNTIVFIKGSQSSRLERVVELLISKEYDKKETLCRQDSYWLSND